MFFHEADVRAVTVAATCNVACALVGCFLVVRRISLMGDALSHAVLPGLVVAVIFTGDVNAGPILLGALAAGVVTTLLTSVAQRYGRVAADASLGVVFTSMFALGVVLVKRYISDVHFDISCIYEGSLLKIALDTIDVGGVEIPRALPAAALVLAVVLGCLALFWKELLVGSFDPGLAHNLKLAPQAMHYLLMVLVSFTTVASFQAVGSILVVAMLIAPPAAAQLLSDRMPRILLIAAGLTLVATVGGYAASIALGVSSAGMMACSAGLLYAAAALGSPRYGVLSRLATNARVALRVRREDVLSRLYRDAEGTGGPATTPEAAQAEAGGGLIGFFALQSLKRRNLVLDTDGRLQLTEAGAAEGSRLVRAHRLWETYLVDQVGVQPDHVHEAAHLMEHYLDEPIRAEIAGAVDSSEDPHGRRIPDGEVPE